MATITIRNLSEDLLERLKAAARRSGRSMEQEIRVLLEQRYRRKDAVLERMRARWKRLPSTSPKEVKAWREGGRK